MLDRLYEDLRIAQVPFMYMAFTMSSHEPFIVPMETKIPGDDNGSKLKNAIAYTCLLYTSGERVLHGICLYYLNTHDKRGTLGLFDLYRDKVGEMEYSPIREQFERLERYMKCLPETINPQKI